MTALHDLDVVFRSFSRSEKISEVLASLGYKSPVPVQSMYIFKVQLLFLNSNLNWNWNSTLILIQFEIKQKFEHLKLLLYFPATRDWRRSCTAPGQFFSVH